MKLKPRIMLALLPLCFLSVPWTAGRLQAQQVWKMYNVNTKHYFSIAAGVGYYSLLENIPEVSTRGGAMGALGFGYEMRYNGFWLGTGIDLNYGSSSMTMAPFEVHREMLDTQGKQVSFHYNVQGYTDTQLDLRIGIPLMVGFCTNGIYGGIGAKFAYAPYTVSKPSIHYVTTGSYDPYIVDFENMPNHFYTEYQTEGRSEMQMRPQGYIIAELGYDLLNRERTINYSLCSVLKLSLYAEYGLNSCMSGAAHDQEPYDVNPANPTQLTIDSYYACHDLSHARIVPLYVGVKCTFMLRIRTANCRCEGPL